MPFQRPERASFISTGPKTQKEVKNMRFQRPERASFISTSLTQVCEIPRRRWFQRPERASFISTDSCDFSFRGGIKSFNALNGLLSFLLKERTWVFILILTMFQRPERASFISTVCVKHFQARSKTGFNALNGLLSFLHKDGKNM